MKTLSGKVAVVTGGASGIGLASATRLAESGARVAVVDLDAAEAAQVATRLGGVAVEADVGKSGAWPGIVEEVTDRLGGIDVAHLNAGVTTGEADITALTDAQYRRALGANVDGVTFGIRALVPAMASRGGGSIVVTASLAALIGYSPDPIYALTKAAVVGLVRALAPQLAEKHITINAICPGLVDTPLIENVRELLEQSGFPIIDPNAVADAAIGCLTGDETGQAMVIQAGREALSFRFARPPGPRAPGGEGKMPPTELAAHDQGRAVPG
jgi:NAD(P)-dependent dehydrogenase (short-subunit alcohol dehydrogenase family)